MGYDAKHRLRALLRVLKGVAHQAVPFREVEEPLLCRALVDAVVRDVHEGDRGDHVRGKVSGHQEAYGQVLGPGIPRHEPALLAVVPTQAGVVDACSVEGA
ncbi:hypothetical protein GCM10020000_86570 [Streptomyces olivoverticillatus]